MNSTKISVKISFQPWLFSDSSGILEAFISHVQVWMFTLCLFHTNVVFSSMQIHNCCCRQTVVITEYLKIASLAISESDKGEGWGEKGRETERQSESRKVSVVPGENG